MEVLSLKPIISQIYLNVHLVLQYYHETSTGRKFRSLIAVQRYLKAEKQDAPILETVKAGNENTVSSKVSLFSCFRWYNNYLPKRGP